MDDALIKNETGERNAQFLRLLGQNELRLVACVHALVPNWNDAEDLLQETRVRLWEQFDQFTPGTDFAAWACTVARFLVQAYRTKTARQRLTFSDELVELVASELDGVLQESDQRVAALVQCVRSLNPRSRDLLRRCYLQGTKIKQVAADLGRPLAATYQAVSRVRRILLNCVQERLADEVIS